MARTLSEVLIDADKATELSELISLWNEIALNKYKYPLTQLWFANEHIRKLVLKSNGSDIEKGKFYHALNEMYPQKTRYISLASI